MRIPVRTAWLCLLLACGPPLAAEKVLANLTGVPLRVLVTRIQAGGAVIALAVQSASGQTCYLDCFHGNHEGSCLLTLNLGAGATLVLAAERQPSAPDALQEIRFRIAPRDGEEAALAEGQEGLWATYGLGPARGLGVVETLTDTGDGETNDSPWEIEPPGRDDPRHRIVPRRSGFRLPCVIL